MYAMKTVSPEVVKEVIFFWSTSETVGAAALWRKGMILDIYQVVVTEGKGTEELTQMLFEDLYIA